MKLSYHQQQFAHHVSKLIAYIYSQGYSCTLGEALRTPEQAKLYAEQGKGIVNSQHCKKLAIDLQLFNQMNDYLMNPEPYEQFGTFWKRLDEKNRWGGDWKKKDACHFERYEL